ncbi:MAG: 50S ribosomal protein L35 [Deltaproteobacteria bacterium]|nr:50S ribosomal protein L35 [Deltaproteobacteria bacterium]
MPKMKSNSGAKKRFKVTAKGKVVRRKAFASHLLNCKSRKRKRNLRKATLVDSANQRSIKRMLPYL